MHSDVGPIDASGHRQILKQGHELLVNFIIVVLHALGPKVEVLSHLTRLMVPSQHDHGIWLRNFHGTDVCNDFRAVHATVDIVSHKDQLLNLATIALDPLEHVEEIVQLAVDVTHDGH